MNQSEARLHSGRSVHFRLSLSPRPSFRFFRGSGSETSAVLCFTQVLDESWGEQRADWQWTVSPQIA